MQQIFWLIKPDLSSSEFGSRSELFLESLLSTCGANMRQVRLFSPFVVFRVECILAVAPHFLRLQRASGNGRCCFCRVATVVFYNRCIPSFSPLPLSPPCPFVSIEIT
jgi:hypothetical protein